MENTGFSLLTLVLFLPLVGFTILLFIREQQESAIKWTAFGTSLVTFVASLLLWIGFNNQEAGLQFVQRGDWLPSYGISYYVGIDGLSLLMVILTTFIMPIAILSSFNSHIFHERGRVKLYYLFMLLLEWAMIGVFVAQDLVIFYIFWEVTLVPMYFLIGIWGAERRIYAAIKFFLYTMAGSILMLLAILYVGIQAGTFAVPEIIAGIQNGTISFAFDGLFSTQSFLFLGFFIAFAIKVPIWPLHSWLPDAHVQAPTAGSVILAGVLLKMGTYGLVRFCLPLYPEASVAWAPVIAVLAVIGIIYGAWVSYAQTDVKKLVAYSSVSHLGFVVLGIFALNAQGIEGGILQMVNHGISTGGLFLLVGMLYERRHTKDIAAYGGIWKALPLFGAISLVVTLSSMGLPGLNGFIGEFTILLGTFGSDVLGFFYAMFATIGVILAAVYMLYMFQKVYLGELDKEENKNLPPLMWNEIAVLIPILIAIFLIGLQPAPFFDTMNASVGELVAHVGQFVTTVAQAVP
ncbi:MAG: NADH-quinone oxidoreductase subunit M [Anaerolineae bacterium]|nr:NADH-quinone oxidoreductase subunit M [Anaerolineae bacterium]NUQ03465.1 NADH-quinone oxidoreductase subunit M [Anaerolineae bacterium]